MNADSQPTADDSTTTADDLPTADDSADTRRRHPRRVALAGGAGGAAGAAAAVTGLFPTIPDPVLAGLGAGVVAAVAVLIARRSA